MDSSLWAFLLLVCALGLFFAEIFIPSGGMILITAMLCLGGSIWAAWGAWGTSAPAMFWAFVSASVILVPAALGGAIWLWPRTSMGRQAEPPTLEEVTPYLEQQRRLAQLVGQNGETETPLNPAGILRIHGQRIHCQSEGVIVASGTCVKVIGVQGNHVIVREVSTEPESPHSDSSDSAKNGPQSSLDFDLPSV